MGGLGRVGRKKRRLVYMPRGRIMKKKPKSRSKNHREIDRKRQGRAGTCAHTYTCTQIHAHSRAHTCTHTHYWVVERKKEKR